MAKSVNSKDKHRWTKKSKLEKPRLEEEALNAELELKYIRKHFYDNIDTIFVKLSLAMAGINVLLILFYPGLRYIASVGGAAWLGFFVLCKYIGRYRGTKRELYGKKLFERVVIIVWLAFEILQTTDNDLSSQEARNAHVSIVSLAMYCLCPIILRVEIPKYKMGPIISVTMSLKSLKYPRFGIFLPCYEALAFFVALSVGFGIGAVIDEMRWRYFLLSHEREEKHNRELSRANRRSKALEDLACGQESYFFEVKR